MITCLRVFVFLSVLQSDYLLYKFRWYVGCRMSLVWKNYSRKTHKGRKAEQHFDLLTFQSQNTSSSLHNITEDKRKCGLTFNKYLQHRFCRQIWGQAVKVCHLTLWDSRKTRNVCWTNEKAPMSIFLYEAPPVLTGTASFDFQLNSAWVLCRAEEHL